MNSKIQDQSAHARFLLLPMAIGTAECKLWLRCQIEISELFAYSYALYADLYADFRCYGGWNEGIGILMGRLDFLASLFVFRVSIAMKRNYIIVQLYQKYNIFLWSEQNFPFWFIGVPYLLNALHAG